MSTGKFLMLSIYVPGTTDDDDPEALADALVAIINDERENNGGPESPCGVGVWPTPQWFGPEQMAHLKELSERLDWRVAPRETWLSEINPHVEERKEET